MTLDLRGLWLAFISCLVGYSWSTEQDAELCDRYQHHYCSYLRTLYRQQKLFGSLKSSSLRCSNCRKVNKKSERRHATYRQTRRLGVIAELLLTLWFETSLAFGCLCIFHFLSSSWPRLQPRYCPWDVCFGWTFWTHLVLNAVVKSRAVAAVCGFLNLVSIYFCIHGRSGWRRGGEAGLSTCESLSVTSQQKQNQIFAWSKLIFMRS